MNTKFKFEKCPCLRARGRTLFENPWFALAGKSYDTASTPSLLKPRLTLGIENMFDKLGNVFLESSTPQAQINNAQALHSSMFEGDNLCLRHQSLASRDAACSRSSQVSNSWNHGENSTKSISKPPAASRTVPNQNEWSKSGTSIDGSQPHKPRSAMFGPQPIKAVSIERLNPQNVFNKICFAKDTDLTI